MKDKSFKAILVVYIALMLIDFITTFMVGAPAEVLEVNPLYKLTNSFIPIYLINFVMVFLIYWLYTREKASPTSRFILMNVMIVVMLARVYAVQNAWHWIVNPPTMIQAKAIATPAMVEQTQKELALILYAPMFVTISTYLGWKFDHTIGRRRD